MLFSMVQKRNKEIILDSNVWVALLCSDDSLSGKAHEILSGLTDYSVVITEYIVLEVASVLKNKKVVAYANAFLEQVLAGQGCSLLLMGQYVPEIASLCIKNHLTNLSYVDNSLLVLSSQYSILTFDKDLQKALDKMR
jgi:predicted nucleic acid-binding protein